MTWSRSACDDARTGLRLGREGLHVHDTLLRVEAELRARFDADSALLTSVGSLTAAKKDAIQAALVDPIDNRLFEAVAEFPEFPVLVKRGGSVCVTTSISRASRHGSTNAPRDR